MDVLKEEWEASSKSDMSVMSHVMLMRERLEWIATTVRDNLNRAQVQQSSGMTGQSETNLWSQENKY